MYIHIFHQLIKYFNNKNFILELQNKSAPFFLIMEICYNFLMLPCTLGCFQTL